MARLVFLLLLLGLSLAVAVQASADYVVLAADPSSTYEARYTYPVAVGTGGESLGETVISIANISASVDNDPLAFQGGVAGKLHQDAGTSVGDTPTYGELGVPAGSVIDTHFTLDGGELSVLAIQWPSEDGDVEPSTEETQQGFGTSFGSSLSGTFMIYHTAEDPPDPAWDVLHVVAPLGTDLDLDFKVTGYTGNIVSFVETFPLGIIGDGNLDGTVDIADFGLLKGGFGIATDFMGGDFNLDDTVDIADFGLLKAHFGDTVQIVADPPPVPAASVALIPEPGSLVLLVSSLLGLAFYLRRRGRA